MLWTVFENNEEIVKAAAGEMPGLQIISYRKFSLPVHKYEVGYKKSGSLPPNIIEEQILDALTAGFTLPVTCEFIASVLGLDTVFIESSVEKLCRLKVISATDEGVLSLTGRGKVYAENHLLPGGETNHEISFYYDKKFGGRYLKAEGKAQIYDKFEQVDEYVTDKTKFISPSLITETGSRMGIEIENPEKGELISGFLYSEIIGSGFTDFMEIWVWDFVNKKAYARVWDFENKCFSKEIERFVCTYTYMSEVTNPEKYIQLKSDNYERETLYSDLAGSVYSAARFENTSVGIDAPVRIAESDEKIEIPDADRYIVLSPWLYGEVTDERMVEKLSSAKYTLFGYGSNVITIHEAIDTLLNITDEQGIPKVLPCLITTLREKEVLAGGKAHFVGSVDYTDADDYYKACESVYIVQDKDCLSVAEKRLNDLFLSEIANQRIIDERFVLAVLNVCMQIMSREDFLDYLHRLCSVSDGKTKYNIYLFMKIKGIITPEEFSRKIPNIDGYDGEHFIY